MTTSELPVLPWNLVAKNLHPHEQLRKKLRQKISKLEKHLHFPAGTAHLHVALEKHPKKPLFTAARSIRARFWPTCAASFGATEPLAT